MRKFSFKAPPPPEPTVPQLSLEEQAIATDEANEKKIEMETVSNDADQLGDIIVKVGEVQTIVSNIPEIKPIDQALVASIADAAVAGTDADPEELAGSMLPDEGVSTESFTNKLKDQLTQMKEAVAAFQPPSTPTE
jgi:hypothetical protein